MERYDLWPEWIRNRIEMAYYEYRIPYWLVVILFGRNAADGAQLLRESQERIGEWFDELEDDDHDNENSDDIVP